MLPPSHPIPHIRGARSCPLPGPAPPGEKDAHQRTSISDGSPQKNMHLFLTGAELDYEGRGRDAPAFPRDSLPAVGIEGRWTDSQDSTDPSASSRTISPEPLRHTGTSGMDPAFHFEDNPQDRPQGSSLQPQDLPNPHPTGFLHAVGLGLPEEPGRCRRTPRAGSAASCLGKTIPCRSLNATWEAAGGDPPGKRSGQLEALPGLGRASKVPKSSAWHPKASSLWLLRAPGAGGFLFYYFFFQAGKETGTHGREKKNLGDCKEPTLRARKVGGSGSDPPAKGCCGGLGRDAAPAKKAQGRATARARPASAGGCGRSLGRSTAGINPARPIEGVESRPVLPILTFILF